MLISPNASPIQSLPEGYLFSSWIKFLKQKQLPTLTEACIWTTEGGHQNNLGTDFDRNKQMNRHLKVDEIRIIGIDC